MEKNWLFSFISGILVIIGIFAPIYVIIAMQIMMVGTTTAFGLLWYWGLIFVSDGSTTLTQFKFYLFPTIIFIFAIISVIIIFYFTWQTKKENTPNPKIVMGTGLVLSILPSIELIYELLNYTNAVGTFSGALVVPFPLAPIFLIIAGLITFFNGYKSK